MNVVSLKDRYRLIIKYTGYLIIAVAFFLLLPLITIFFYPEEAGQSLFFVLPSIVAGITGVILIFLAGNPPREVVLNLQEGGVIVILSWFLAIIFSSLPFILGLGLSFTQAFFEATSGWTTTGLSVINVEEVPAIFLLWRSITQFLGGAGLVVIMLASILHPHGFGLYMAEGRSDKLLPHVKRSTAMIMYIYSGYILAGIILYRISGMNFFEAINHSIAALSTGGFSTRTASIGEFQNLKIELVTIILMILGSINFATHFAFLRGKVRIFFKNAEVKLMLFLFAMIIPLVFFFTTVNLSEIIGERIRIAVFEVVSALTTTGFAIDDFNNWNNFGFLLIILLMLIGGGTGSTAGGIKLYRVYLMIKSIFWNLMDYFLPSGAVTSHYIWRGENKVFIKPEYIRETANYIFLYLLTYFSGVLIFLAHGYGFRESLFEFGSALGTVGLSVGITQAGAPTGILWTEIAGMLLGRLEFFVIFFSLIKIAGDIKLFTERK